MIQLRINCSRAEDVITRLSIAFKNRMGVFADTKELLENNIPPGVSPRSLEHARFLFYLVFNDYGTKSAALYEKAKRLYAEDPSLFSPGLVLQRFTSHEDPNLIESTGVKLGTRFPRETAKRWYFNSEKLWRDYNADPRSIFSTSTNAKEAFCRVRQFRGFGPKIGALLLRTFVGCGFTYLDDLEAVLMPVDVHDTRIAFWTGVAQTLETSKEIGDYHRFARRIQHTWSDACKNTGLNWLEIDRALWILGSKGCTKRLCESCPLNSVCHKGRADRRADYDDTL
jgi:endonuclease III